MIGRVALVRHVDARAVVRDIADFGFVEVIDEIGSGRAFRLLDHRSLADRHV
jgi:hypothetical protein